MSRNLGLTSCYYCPSDVTLLEAPREITAADCGVYFGEYRGMLVANAECPLCLAQYLAWVKPPPWEQPFLDERETFYDLSFRSTFDDEPGDADLPKFQIETTHARKGPFVRSK